VSRWIGQAHPRAGTEDCKAPQGGLLRPLRFQARRAGKPAEPAMDREGDFLWRIVERFIDGKGPTRPALPPYR
jgi:hypothetical protein